MNVHTSADEWPADHSDSLQRNGSLTRPQSLITSSAKLATLHSAANEVGGARHGYLNN